MQIAIFSQFLLFLIRITYVMYVKKEDYVNKYRYFVEKFAGFGGIITLPMPKETQFQHIFS